MNTPVTIKGFQITDNYFTIEYVASEIGVINRVRVPLDSPMDEDSIKRYIADDMEKIRDKIMKMQELKRLYADRGFSIEID